MKKEYSMEEVRKARRLAKDIPSKTKLAQYVEPSDTTLSNWEDMGLIDTGPSPHYSRSTIEKADALYDQMPLTEAEEAIGVPHQTLARWAERGWISTDKNWRSRRTGTPLRVSPREIVEAYFEREDRSYRDVASMLPVSKPTVGKYVRKYKQGDLSDFE